MILKKKLAEAITDEQDLTVLVTFQDADSLEAFTAAVISEGATRVQMGTDGQGHVRVTLK